MKNKISICKTYCYQADIKDTIILLVLFILNKISGGGGQNIIAIIFRPTPLCISMSVNYHGSDRFFLESFEMYINM